MVNTGKKTAAFLSEGTDRNEGRLKLVDAGLGVTHKLVKKEQKALGLLVST